MQARQRPVFSPIQQGMRIGSKLHTSARQAHNSGTLAPQSWVPFHSTSHRQFCSKRWYAWSRSCTAGQWQIPMTPRTLRYVCSSLSRLGCVATSSCVDAVGYELDPAGELQMMVDLVQRVRQTASAVRRDVCVRL